MDFNEGTYTRAFAGRSRLLAALAVLLTIALALFAAGLAFDSIATAAESSISQQDKPVEPRRLIVVAEPHPPYEMVGKDGNAVGSDIDLLDVIFKRMGVSYEVRLLPWKRAWSQMQSGDADMSLSTSAKPERAQFAFFAKETMWDAEFVFFTRVEKVSQVDMDLENAARSGMKIGVIAGNSYHDDFWAAFPYQDQRRSKLNPQLQEGLNAEANFKKLAKGRFDLFPYDRNGGLHEVRRLGLQDEIKPYGKVIFTKRYSAAFSRSSLYPGIQRIAARFDEELVAMKRSGEYQKIRDRWAGEVMVAE